MPRHVIIDGNNMLYAMHAHAPIPSVGRETMVKVIERWARRGTDEVTLVFDGPEPIGGLSRQMASSRITVRFSAPKSADDIIVALIHRARDPGQGPRDDEGQELVAVHGVAHGLHARLVLVDAAQDVAEG